MEVKINKEIRQYKENIFFGLTMRQFVCSALACIVAVGIYFITKPIFNNTGTVSWLCMAGAVPFALLGFVKYNGMTAEKFFIAWVKSEILTPKKLTFKPNNLYLGAPPPRPKRRNKKKAKKVKQDKKEKKNRKKTKTDNEQN